MAHELMAPAMFGALVLFLLFGYPVAFSLAANGIFFGLIGIELGLLLLGHLNLFHDHSPSRNSGDDSFSFHSVLCNQLSNSISDRFGVDNHIVLDGIFRQRHDTQFEQAKTVLIDRGFDHFNRARSDIEGDVTVFATHGVQKPKVHIIPERGHNLLFEKGVLLFDAQT